MTLHQLHTFGPRGASPSALPTEAVRGARLGDTPPSPSIEDPGEILRNSLHSAPDPYKVATGFLIDSYERTIAILEAERDYLEARLQRAEGKS